MDVWSQVVYTEVLSSPASVSAAEDEVQLATDAASQSNANNDKYWLLRYASVVA